MYYRSAKRAGGCAANRSCICDARRGYTRCKVRGIIGCAAFTKKTVFDIITTMKIYYCCITEFNDLRGSEYLLSRRKERIARYIKTNDKLRCLAAGLLLRRAFGDEKYSQIVLNDSGKPYLPNGPFFNLSHSGEYVLLAVADSEVGIDVERITSYSRAVAARCFTDEELKWLYLRNRDRAFFRIWTGKESIMKAVGLGFRMAPQSFSVMPIADGPHEVDGKTWFLTWFSLPGHEICAACATDEPVDLIRLGRSELLSETS